MCSVLPGVESGGRDHSQLIPKQFLSLSLHLQGTEASRSATWDYCGRVACSVCGVFGEQCGVTVVNVNSR